MHAEKSSAMLAINVQSIQQIEIISQISLRSKTHIIIQFSAKYIPYFEQLIGLQVILDKYKNNQYLFFHLDHCIDDEIIFKCIDLKFDSVMFDGSSMNIEENIEKAKKIVDIAHGTGVLVEGEVGIISGVEDGFGVNGSTNFDVVEAKCFYSESGVDMLALGIGNAHGIYKNTNIVNIELLGIFQNHVDGNCHLVLHGGTGLTQSQITTAIKYGVVKVNYSTEFKLHYQNVINNLSGRSLHDEIFLFDSLIDVMDPLLSNLLHKMNL
jgi:ketose-bisphosphate aldolase